MTTTASDQKTNIAIVGSGPLCIEILEKTVVSGGQTDINAHIVAVSDPDPDSEGMQVAGNLGLACFTDYRQLYAPELEIDLIIILSSGNRIFNEILASRPPHIRILSYEVFRLFWDAINTEARKLRERNIEIETVLNGIRDFICVISPDREILFANEAFIEKMRFLPEEVIGKKCFEVFQRRTEICSSDDISCPLENVVRNKRKIQRVYERINRNGELRYTEVTIFPIWDESNRIAKFIDISRDITERKIQEDELTRKLELMVEERTRELRETHEKLMHKDKMSSLGKLSASVVHEINNPIAGILNLIVLMKRIVAGRDGHRKGAGPFQSVHRPDGNGNTPHRSHRIQSAGLFAPVRDRTGSPQCQPADRENPVSQRQPFKDKERNGEEAP
jgi:two-component system NtrC family sensor kinase